jgi:hypothetical protein
MAVSINNVFRNVTSGGLVNICRSVGGTCCLHLQKFLTAHMMSYSKREYYLYFTLYIIFWRLKSLHKHYTLNFRLDRRAAISVHTWLRNLILTWLNGPRRLRESWRLQFCLKMSTAGVMYQFLSLQFIPVKGNDCEGNNKPEVRGQWWRHSERYRDLLAETMVHVHISGLGNKKVWTGRGKRHATCHTITLRLLRPTLQHARSVALMTTRLQLCSKCPFPMTKLFLLLNKHRATKSYGGWILYAHRALS